MSSEQIQRDGSGHRPSDDTRATRVHGSELDEHGGRSTPLRPLGGLLIDRSVAWTQWFGVARLSVAAVSVLAIAIGMWWLLRAPPVPVEQTLPMVSGQNGPSASSPSVPESVASRSPDADVAMTATTVLSVMIVHVAGHVERPGVYSLGPGARVADAVVAAGGATEDGDLNALNLAAVADDGSRIYVPAVGEVDPASIMSSGGDTAPSDPDGDGAATPTGPVNINTADAAELERLPGVGPATAAAIVDDRQRNGPFGAVEDLERVRGIGPAKLAGLIDLVTT